MFLNFGLTILFLKPTTLSGCIKLRHMQNEKIEKRPTKLKSIQVDLDPSLGTSDIVFPPDTRTRVDDTTAWPYNTIGLVQMRFPNGKRFLGTGTLINENHVLTCAHNLYSAEDGGSAVEVVFSPGRNGEETPYGTYYAKTIYYPELYSRLAPQNPNENPGGVVEDYSHYLYDYGLIRLNKIVDRDMHFGLFAATDEQLRAMDVNITGYPGDKRPRKTMWQANGTFDNGISDDFLFYTIDTYKGESGSAVNGFVPDTPPYRQIVGIHVAGSVRKQTNFAVRLTLDKMYQILEWMTQ